jgi:hypothetical protein
MGTVYASADRKRFFDVPADARLPPGPMEVSSITGASLKVDPVALDVYEISEEEARTRAMETLRGFADSVRAVTLTATRALAEAPKLDPEAVAARESRVADALKLSREQLKSDPKAVGAAVKSALDGLLNAVRETAESPDAARARMADVGEAVRQEGGAPEVAAAVSGLADKLREVMTREDTVKRLEEAAEGLRKAAADLRAETAARRAAKAGGPVGEA